MPLRETKFLVVPSLKVKLKYIKRQFKETKLESRYFDDSPEGVFTQVRSLEVNLMKASFVGLKMKKLHRFKGNKTGNFRRRHFRVLTFVAEAADPCSAVAPSRYRSWPYPGVCSWPY